MSGARHFCCSHSRRSLTHSLLCLPPRSLTCCCRLHAASICQQMKLCHAKFATLFSTLCFFSFAYFIFFYCTFSLVLCCHSFTVIIICVLFCCSCCCCQYICSSFGPNAISSFLKLKTAILSALN